MYQLNFLAWRYADLLKNGRMIPIIATELEIVILAMTDLARLLNRLNSIRIHMRAWRAVMYILGIFGHSGFILVVHVFFHL